MNYKINNSKKIDLINEFILSTDLFWEENKDHLDEKHLKIVAKFEQKYKNNLELYSKDLIDWDEQSNLGAPNQLNLSKIKNIGYNNYFKILLKTLFRFNFVNHFNKVSFFDDIEIIKANDGLNILKDFPVHKTINSKEYYLIDKETSSNNRWNRYIYIASQVKKHNLLNNLRENWLDIGSYYGGLQIILKKYFKKTNFFLVDFNHQLCRSYVYLKSIYPDSTHILPKDLKKNYEGIDNAFFYVPVSKLRNIENLKFDLVTNFFSFGEMTRESLNYYLNSKIIENAKSLYLVNRIVSSPYFEPTYTNDINIYDYNFKDFKSKYFDIFPIHNYKNIKRKLFGRTAFRPISSPYFEKILIKK